MATYRALVAKTMLLAVPFRPLLMDADLL